MSSEGNVIMTAGNVMTRQVNVKVKEMSSKMLLFFKLSVSTLRNIKRVKTAIATLLNAGRHRIHKYH